MVIYGHYVRKVGFFMLLHQENPFIQFRERSALDFPMHLHDVLEIVFLHRGSCEVICANRRYALGPGDLFVSFPNQPHGYENSRDVVSDVLIVPATILTPWRTQISQQIPAHPVLPFGDWEDTGISSLLDMIRPEQRQLTQPILQGYAMVIVGKLLPRLRLIPQPDQGGDTLHRLLRYVNQHYREPLTRSEIARAVGYNESYISHLFAQGLGTTLKEYITSLRLKDARQLLTETDMTVSQISLTLGFGSIRSFNRAFAQEFTQPPSAYRAGKS